MFRLRFMPLLTVALLLVGCFSDQTTLDVNPISEILIDSTSIKSEYNIYKNETVSITPRFSQTNTDKAVSYTWEIDLKTYSTEPEFVYTGEKLGSMNCRLILENEDGRSFYAFTLNVNSPYEEGYTILSQDTDGRSMLSFMQKPIDTDEPAYFYDYDCFAVNNPDLAFASHAADLLQSGGRLIIACQGGNDASDLPTVYYLNEKTMVAENVLTVGEYADFKPTLLGIPSVDASGVAYPIICANGKVYEFSTTEGAIVKPSKLPYTYAQNMIVRDAGSGWSFEIILWDSEINALCEIYNGYGPYFCSKNYHQTRATCTGTANYFNGKTFKRMTLVRKTKTQLATSSPEIIVLAAANASLTQKVILNSAFWTYNSDLAETTLTDNGGFKLACMGTCPITESTPVIANQTYYSLLFADGNKVRRWNYTSTALISAADVLATVGTSSAVITAFEMSSDHTKTYVCFYEPEQSGKNGSMWVIDTDKGTILEKYDNICYRPVKVIYKNK